ncbi:MAG: peptidylprolyl isomerase [Roseicyclus sp.]|nr:peptidylprolyl isomerase [Roseicyclus sp.]MBO6623913.1 peptidylprolyl isomerase [Roseicyclus sp.]MBO6921071.1 peptidylprolyl isomerase [Roseicyclus sp.]
MTKVTPGTSVSFHYIGTLDDGSVFDSSDGRDPLQFTMGEGEIIPGLEAAFEGMSLGDRKTVTVPADQAYGQHIADGVQQVPREAIPDDIPLELGTKLQLQTPEGQTMVAAITEVSDTHVTLDANHPLAGQDLTFAVHIVALG